MNGLAKSGDSGNRAGAGQCRRRRSAFYRVPPVGSRRPSVFRRWTIDPQSPPARYSAHSRAPRAAAGPTGRRSCAARPGLLDARKSRSPAMPVPRHRSRRRPSRRSARDVRSARSGAGTRRSTQASHASVPRLRRAGRSRARAAHGCPVRLPARHHLRKAVDRHLLRSPVELVDPVVAELAHKGVAGAGRPRVAVFGEHGHVVPGKLLHAPADLTRRCPIAATPSRDRPSHESPKAPAFTSESRSIPIRNRQQRDALEPAHSLPPASIAHVVLRLTGADDEPPVPLTPEEHAAIAASKAAAAVANLRPTNRAGRCGLNRVCEA